MKSTQVPNFFYVGVGRSGSTSLYHYFKDHPEVYLTKRKELHYFSRDILRDIHRNNKSKLKHFVLDKRSYLDFFKDVKDEKIIADMSPMDSFSKDSAKEIYKLNPKAKVLFSFRDPTDYIYATYRSFLSIRLEKERDFLKAIDKKRKVKRGEWNTKDFYYHSIDFAQHIEQYAKVFPRDQIMVYFYKDFVKDTKKVYKQILDFLGVSKVIPSDFKRFNSSSKLKFPIIMDLANYFFGKFDLTPIMKNKFAVRLAELYLSLALRPAKRPPLPSNVRNQLKKDLKPNVVSFERVLKKYSFVESDFNLCSYWEY